MRVHPTRALLAAVMVGCLLTTGCAAGQEVLPAEPSLADIYRGNPDTILAEVETTGGMCAAGPCGATLTIHASGDYLYTGYGATDRGHFSRDDLAPLVKMLAASPVHTAKDEPFCASATDGDDVNLTYRLPDDDTARTVSSCDYDFTQDALAEALGRLHASAGEAAAATPQ